MGENPYGNMKDCLQDFYSSSAVAAAPTEADQEDLHVKLFFVGCLNAFKKMDGTPKNLLLSGPSM